MRRPRAAVPLVLASLLAAAASAAPPSSQLAMRGEVLVDPPGGLARLPLPPAVRAQCRADLSDLRLLDRSGSETPFLVDVARGERSAVSERVAGVVVEAFRDERRREGAPPLRRERYVIEGPANVDPALPWTLVVQAPARDFVRRIDVEQASEGAEAVPLVSGGSIFRLERAGAERTRTELPGLVPGRLVVTLEGEDGAYLSPVFAFERTREMAPPPRLEVPLVVRGTRSEHGATVLELDRPAGIVPEQIRFETTSPTFARRLRVSDVLPTGRATVIGTGEIERLRPGDEHERLTIDVRPAQGTRLDVAIADQDSPPLAGVEVCAVVREVALVFSLPSASADAPAGTLLFGGGRVAAPHYDLAALAALARDGEGATPLVPARLGAIGPNPAFDDAPVLGFAMRPGATIDPRLFAWRRSLLVPASPTGLSRLRLGVQDLAHARSDLGDVRIADADDRQWPYLVERDAVVTSEPLRIAQAVREGRRSRHELVPPTTPLRLAGIEIDVDAGFVDRAFTLLATGPDGQQQALAGGRLRRAARTREPLRVEFADTAVRSLTLLIENGDEAPLVVTAVAALCPLPELYVAAPAGEYALLAGDEQAAAPQYEIAQLRSTVLALPAASVEAGPPGPNPAFSRGARAAQRIAEGRWGPRLAVWGILVLAVVALLVLTVRVLRRESA